MRTPRSKADVSHLEVTEMTTTTERQAHIDELLTRLTQLVRSRELLESRDPKDRTLQATSAQIEQLHWELARTVQADQRLAQVA